MTDYAQFGMERFYIIDPDQIFYLPSGINLNNASQVVQNFQRVRSGAQCTSLP